MKEKLEGLSAKRAERAKNDCMSGRELFISDASLFVDDAEAYEKYQREEQSDDTEEKAKSSGATWEPSTSTSFADAAELPDDEDDDDELDLDELNEPEASLSRTSIQSREPGIEA